MSEAFTLMAEHVQLPREQPPFSVPNGSQAHRWARQPQASDLCRVPF